MAKSKAEIQREYAKRTNYEAQKKYKEKNTTRTTITLFYNTESDIIEKLESVENKSGYIKNLIRQDIAKQNNNR